MSVLSAATQKQVEDKLVADGLIAADGLSKLHETATKSNRPFFEVLLAEGNISNEDLTKAIAFVSKVP